MSHASAQLATNEDRLDSNQRLRHRMIDSLVDSASAHPDNGGCPIPTSAEDRGLLMELLRDSDRTSLGAMKIKSDNAQSQRDAILAGALHQLSQKIGRDVFRAGGDGEVYDGEVVRPAIAGPRHVEPEGALPNIEPVPGEMGQGTETLTYSQMVSLYGKRKDTGPVPEEENE